MRLLINCPSGESRLLQVDAEARVSELKQVLQEAEGILLKQQVLTFAGMDLKDHLTLADHRLEDYSLSDEIVLYLAQRLANPISIYITSRNKLSQMTAELVESDMPVGEVRQLLELRGYAAGFDPNSSIFCKRQDGSFITMHVNPSLGIHELQQKIAEVEGILPKNLSFLQAQDGHLHVVVWPSATSIADNTTYSRGVQPQPGMVQALPSQRAKGQPLPKLAKELCMLP